MTMTDFNSACVTQAPKKKKATPHSNTAIAAAEVSCGHTASVPGGKRTLSGSCAPSCSSLLRLRAPLPLPDDRDNVTPTASPMVEGDIPLSFLKLDETCGLASSMHNLANVMDTEEDSAPAPKPVAFPLQLTIGASGIEVGEDAAPALDPTP